MDKNLKEQTTKVRDMTFCMKIAAALPGNQPDRAAAVL